MKTICVIALLFVYSIFYTVKAQSFDWAVKGGLWAYDYGYGTVTDAEGNIFVAGKFEMNAIFSGVTLTCRGNHDMFLAKYYPNGELRWIKTAGGTMGDYAHCIAIDAKGDVYVAGEIETVADFDGVQVAAKSDNDIFIAKYKNSGELVYVKSAGGYLNDKALGIAVDKVGNAYLTGIVEGPNVEFGSIKMATYGGKDMFIAKYDSVGNIQWAKKAGGPKSDEGKAISVNDLGEIYVTGFFKDTAVFDGASGSISVRAHPNNAGSFDDAFIARYDSNGNVLWVKTAGSAWDDDGWGIYASKSGKVFITGEFNADATFDPSHILYSRGMADIFVACYDNMGTLLWVTQAGGSMIDRARAISADMYSNVYLTGQFGGNATFGTDTLKGSDSLDIFVASFDANGGYRWALAAGGEADADSLGPEAGNAICTDAKGNVFVTGGYLKSSTFGNVTLPTYTRTDMFISKIVQQGFTSVQEYASDVNLHVYPNPAKEIISITLQKEQLDKWDLALSNAIGQVVYSERMESSDGHYQKNIDVSQLTKGIYYLKVTAGGAVKQVKKIVVY